MECEGLPFSFGDKEERRHCDDDKLLRPSFSGRDVWTVVNVLSESETDLRPRPNTEGNPVEKTK